MTISKLDQQLINVKIEVDENYVYMLDKASNNIMKKCLLRELEIIRIHDKSKLYSKADFSDPL